MNQNHKNICLVCNQSIADKDSQYHPKCVKLLFGQKNVPEMPYTNTGLKKLAKKIVRNNITIPGVQAKLSLQLDNQIKEGKRFTIVGLWGNFILKPPVDIYPNLPEIENLTMNLAKKFKIKIVPQGLISLKSRELAYITRRIDRLPDGKKIHMEDMCQLSERLTEDKYKGSMEYIGKIIKRFSSNPLFDCIRFFEIALFSFLVGNADMHLKNFSLIYPVNGMIQLSPAYDLLSTRLVIPEKDDPEEMALTLNGKKRKITIEDFLQFAKNLGLNEKQFQNIINQFSKTMPLIDTHMEMNFLPVKTKKAFRQLISDRSKRIFC
jgi:serine/threonine-protein kinase HipA